MLNSTAVDGICPVQEAESAQTLLDILRTPEESFNHIRRYSTAVILASVYGQRGRTYDSAKVQALYNVQERFTEILAPGATPPMDAFPFLKYLPDLLSPWRPRAREIRKQQRDLYYNLLHETQQRIADGRSPDCLLKKVIKDQEKSGLDEEHIVYTGGTLVRLDTAYMRESVLTFDRWRLAQTPPPRVCTLGSSQ